MGRLFWKFFLFLWLAQLLTSIGVGVTIWLHRDGHPPHDHPPPPAAMSPGAKPSLQPPGPPPRSLLPPLMPIIAGSVVSLIFAALLAAYFARPIRSLGRAFDAVAEGRLDTRIAAAMGRRKDELAELGVGFDHMAERLQSLVEGQRRLLHDVSHELRSPLARLQAAADLLRQQPDRSAVFVERIERDTSRMDRLVGELLTLARLDAGKIDRPRERLDLRELVADVVGDAEVEAAAKGCRLELAVEGDAVISGNAELVGRAVENVLRNALRHSPAGGRVRVSVAVDGVASRAMVAIADEGPGVPEADLEAIFQPFFRSRAEDAYSGYGLGLAITRRVVESHGGSVTALNRPGGGLLVSLSLPVGPRS